MCDVVVVLLYHTAGHDRHHCKWPHIVIARGHQELACAITSWYTGGRLHAIADPTLPDDNPAAYPVLYVWSCSSRLVIRVYDHRSHREREAGAIDTTWLEYYETISSQNRWGMIKMYSYQLTAVLVLPNLALTSLVSLTGLLSVDGFETVRERRSVSLPAHSLTNSFARSFVRSLSH